MRAWLRRNRWGLVALPVVAVFATGANAQRITDYWWTTDLRRPAATAAPGDWVTHSDEFTDAAGTTRRSIELRVGTPVEVDTITGTGGPVGLDLPAGLRAVRIPLDLRADPDQVLTGCAVALVDAGGNRYEYLSSVAGITQPLHPCLDDERPGPYPSIVKGEPRRVDEGRERPPAWSTRPVVLVPVDAEITEVILWWHPPRFARVELPRSPAASGRLPRPATR